jgi:uncharacterized protein (UPF0332 family)
VVGAPELLTKAIRASYSAALLLAGGDINGACNRACYAMFIAARAALLAAGAPVDPTSCERIMGPSPHSDCPWSRPGSTT